MPRSRPSSSSEESEADTVSVTASPRRLRLLALLHYLWDAAGLTTWRKAYGRRSWWIVHRELCLVLARARTRSGPLSDILFVPPPYVLEDKERLASERRRFLHRLQPVAGKPTGLGLLVAELKGQEPAQYGRKLRFKHLPDFSVFVDSDTAKRFDRAAARKVRLVEATPNSHLMAIATFALKGSYAEIREIALMAVDGRWVPFAGEREHALLEALAERDFVRCLPYNLPADAPIATAVLLDGDGPTRTVVFVEVRHRRTAVFGGGAASVDAGKRRRLVLAAQQFLAGHRALRDLPCRFDVVAAEGDPASPVLHWLRDAFRADD